MASQPLVQAMGRSLTLNSNSNPNPSPNPSPDPNQAPQHDAQHDHLAPRPPTAERPQPEHLQPPSTPPLEQLRPQTADVPEALRGCHLG